METTTEFDFAKKSEFTMNLGSNIILHIEKNSYESFAILYFTDEITEKKIKIPNDIVVYTYDGPSQEILEANNLEFYHQYYLYWTYNYTIEYNKIEILHLVPQRKWNIIPPPRV